MWKKLSDNNDILIYEKRKKNFKIRIEARLNKNSWTIYKTYFTDKMVDFVEEYSTETRKEAVKIVKTLTKEKDLTIREIKEFKKISDRSLNINLERAYKEYDVEKWFFSFGKEKKINIITIRFGEAIDVDIVIHEKYRFFEKMIIDELVQMLGLNKIDLNINQNVYFFNRKTYNIIKSKNKSVVIGKIEMGVGTNE